MSFLSHLFLNCNRAAHPRHGDWHHATVVARRRYKVPAPLSSWIARHKENGIGMLWAQMRLCKRLQIVWYLGPNCSTFSIRACPVELSLRLDAFGIFKRKGIAKFSSQRFTGSSSGCRMDKLTNKPKCNKSGKTDVWALSTLPCQSLIGEAQISAEHMRLTVWWGLDPTKEHLKASRINGQNQHTVHGYSWWVLLNATLNKVSNHLHSFYLRMRCVVGNLRGTCQSEQAPLRRESSLLEPSGAAAGWAKL